MTHLNNSLTTVGELLAGLINDPCIDSQENLLDSGKLTSLTSMNLVVAIEDHFGIQIPNAELNRKNFSSLQSISEMVDRILNP